MMASRLFLANLKKIVPNFGGDRSGATAIIFGLAFVPAMMAVGAALDFYRAETTRSGLQKAIDTAVLAGVAASDGGSVAAATIAFNANAPKGSNASIAVQADGSGVSATATASVQTAFMKIAGVNAITLSVKGAAGGGRLSSGNGSCIVALGNNLSKTSSALTLNGAPTMNLSGCDIYSNTSMTCNGHGGGASNSFAVGNVTACTHPAPNASPWTDPNNLAGRAANIMLLCSGAGSGVSWAAGATPSAGANFLGPIFTSSGTEYHVCGDLNLSGSGALLPSATGDVLIVVENGSLNVANHADVSLSNSTFVLTGDNAHTHQVNFPNGKGQLATLNVSAPKDAGTPWKGIAIYVDPNLVEGVANTWGVFDDDWGPGSNLVFDGVVYMPYTDLTLNGNTQSGGEACSLLVVNTFTSNGTPSIAFSQSDSACQAAGIVSRLLIPVRLTQ
jgi:Flp pilus assembly protein TadG